MIQNFLTALRLGIIGYLFLVGLLFAFFGFVKLLLRIFTKTKG
ncbi:MAG TPA: hypothetical protein PLP64_05715 [Pseudothermotoga sp.]|nr:hypothetical protein [Pseudothermotoga sp.]HOK83707.1 hypothetical protein [Pseudothermotoga sp.]HPP69346.1 hypothetical protein [Pseudothermotoga sp.]